MRNFRIQVVFLTLFAVSAVLAGCLSRGTGNTLRISSWGDTQENAILLDLMAEFQKTHPALKVQLERIPFGEYSTKLLTEIAGGTAPDVIFVEVGNFVDFYLRGAFEPLNPFIQADKFDLTGYYPQVMDRFTVDSQVLVIPRDTAPIGVIYYNKSAFDESGVPYPSDDWDWNQFVEVAKKVTKRDASGQVVRWGFVDDNPNWDAWVYDAGGSAVDDVKHPTKWTYAEDPKTLQGLQFRADLIYKHKVLIPPASITAMGGTGTSDLFATGRAAMFLSGIWKTPMFREIKNFKWDVALFPKNPDGTRTLTTGGSGYGVLKTSKHKQEAWELVKFLSGEEGAKRLAATGLTQPALMNIANSPAFLDGKDPLNKKFLLEAVKYVKYGPMCRNWGEVSAGLITPELDKVGNGTETAEEALKKLKPLLEKNPPQLR